MTFSIHVRSCKIAVSKGPHIGFFPQLGAVSIVEVRVAATVESISYLLELEKLHPQRTHVVAVVIWAFSTAPRVVCPVEGAVGAPEHLLTFF